MDPAAIVSLESVEQIDEKTFNGGEKNIGVLLSGTFISAFKNRIDGEFVQNFSDYYEMIEEVHNNYMLVISDPHFIKNLKYSLKIRKIS